MAHDLGDLAWKEGMSETCSYSFSAIAGQADALKAEGMTEAQLSKAAKHGEWGTLQGMAIKGQIKAEQVLFKGTRITDGNKLQLRYLGFEANKPLVIEWIDSAIMDTYLTFQDFEKYWLDAGHLEWNLGKASKVLDVPSSSNSIGAMSDEDAATMFVKTKDELAQQKGILDLKGTNKALDDEVYDAIAKQTGYTKAEIKAKVDAYKSSGKKLSSLKKKVVKKEAKVPKPHGVPIQPTKEAVEDAVKQVVDKVDASPQIAAKVYQDEDVASAYIKAKDDLASLESNDWTLYTQSDEFNNAIYERMRDKYGIQLDNDTIEKAIANYTGAGNKLSVLKKKLAKSKDDPWTPKADTLKKSKEQSFHVTAPKPGEVDLTGLKLPTPPSASVEGIKVEQMGEFDISTLSDFNKQNIYDAFKSHSGTYLTSSPESIYEAAVQTAKTWGKTLGFDEGDALTILKVVDERGAIKFGVQNEHLFENKLVEWLQTPQGKTWMQTKAEADYWLSNQPALPDDSDLFDVMTTTQARSMQTTMGDWTYEQQQGLRFYTGSGYRDMNGFLRGKTRAISDVVKRYIRDAKAAMKPVTRNFLVHRGTNYTQFGVNSFEELVRMVGMDVTDEGFVSTSVGGRAAFSSNNVIMEIEVPKGTKAAYLKPISAFPSENELLLAPGTRFRILQVKRVGHQTQVRLRVII